MLSASAHARKQKVSSPFFVPLVSSAGRLDRFGDHEGDRGLVGSKVRLVHQAMCLLPLELGHRSGVLRGAYSVTQLELLDVDAVALGRPWEHVL